MPHGEGTGELGGGGVHSRFRGGPLVIYGEGQAGYDRGQVVYGEGGWFTERGSVVRGGSVVYKEGQVV